jgi:sarcosine oxidase
VRGSLNLGPEDGAIVGGTLRACQEHELPYELLTAAEVERRIPAWRLPPGVVGLLQPDGGFLAAEASVRAHADAAVAAGAELHEQEAVLEWEPTRDGVSVRTARGVYAAARLVLCPGAWAPRLLRLPWELLTVERQVIAWFDAAYSSDSFPVFVADNGANYYGVPPHDGRGVKIGRMHHPGTVVDPERNGVVDAHELEAIESFARAWLPSAGAIVQTSACLFTMTADRNFVIDLHPDAPNVVVASVCSGHGFKFAPVIGEILADLALVGDTAHPIDFLRLRSSRPLTGY